MTKRRNTNSQGYLDSDAFALHMTTPQPDGWQPSRPPELRGEKVIRLDFETNGLKWWAGEKPVGLSYFLPESGRKGYLPFGHQGGGNLDEESVKEWARRELPGVHMDNSNTKFDVHQSRAWGVDFVELGMTFGDVQHRAALLDDLRFTFGIDQLAKEFLGEDEGKYDLNIRDKGQLWMLPAWCVEPYAIQDVELVDRLCRVMDPMMGAQNLGIVHKLEQDIIPVVVEMEKNGCLLDMETLTRWQREAARELEDMEHNIYRATGIHLESFDSGKQIESIFKKRGIPITTFTKGGKPSFTADVLKRAAEHDPVIKDLLYGSYLVDLDSKFLSKYLKTADPATGWIRFNLHQLRSGRDEGSNFGTVSGRFSSAGDENGGFNVQQVISPKKQKEMAKDRKDERYTKYLVRNLFKPAAGAQWLAVDADQIEYRIFAHFSDDPEILAAYAPVPGMTDAEMKAAKRGRYTDYHDKVQLILQRAKPDIPRKHTKITNFCKLFGASIIKFAWTLGTISDAVFNELDDKYQIGKWRNARRGEREANIRQEPALQEALAVYDTYDSMFPAGKRTLEMAKKRARDRGYVKTILGRRARFKGREHSALNRAVQGTAADINKRVMVEVYKQRKDLELLMRMTVHDENDFDLHNPSKLKIIEDVFNTQYIPLKVDILWTAEVGPSWGEAKGKA